MPNNLHAPAQMHANTANSASYAALASDVNTRLAAARPRLARLARLNGAKADEAEDIAQETLLTAWRSLDRLRAADRFDAWLDGICRNICHRMARHAINERSLAAPLTMRAEDEPQPPALDLVPATGGDPLDDLTQRELAALLDSALGLLNEATRDAVRLRYLADLPTEEAAARLGLTINTLEARLSRARKQLRAALNGPLRAQAVEFGLALAPADEAGWRDSRLWCHFCGRARLLGILDDAPDGGGRMLLRCPQCWSEFGVEETTISSMPLLAGIKTFRPAMKRLLRASARTMVGALQDGAPCLLCGALMTARLTHGSELPMYQGLTAVYTQHFYVVATCHRCETYVTGAASIAGSGNDRIVRFILERERFVLEPELIVTYQSLPAIRFGLRDLATNERLIYFADPETLALRGIATS
ncbi:MAG TPA: RNA polymerase sigma factor [Ktedonobacterales bacterium]